MAGLLLLGWGALLTFENQGRFSSNGTLWTTASETIRSHVNARQAALDEGRMFDAIDECQWLLNAAKSPVEIPYPYSSLPPGWRRDVRKVCLEAAPSSP